MLHLNLKQFCIDIVRDNYCLVKYYKRPTNVMKQLLCDVLNLIRYFSCVVLFGSTSNTSNCSQIGSKTLQSYFEIHFGFVSPV